MAAAVKGRRRACVKQHSGEEKKTAGVAARAGGGRLCMAPWHGQDVCEKGRRRQRGA